jgi:hypothetical protein
MAAFLDRALKLPATSNDYCNDAGSIFEPSINRLAASGITSRCTATTFYPSGLVTRGQMAAFLHRAFGRSDGERSEGSRGIFWGPSDRV